MSVDVRGPDGKITRFPDGTDDATISRVMASVYAKKAAPKPKSVARELWDGTVNKVAGMVQGRASVVDMLAQGAGKIMSASGKPLEYAADAIGADSLASGMRYVNNALANPPTIGGAVESIAPTPQDTLGKADRIAAQLVGSLGTGRETNALLNATGLIPKGVPKGFKAPRKPGKTVEDAPQIIADAAKAKVRVMTSDLRPPQTFMGKLTRATGEKIPFAGTAGDRARQQAQRVESVKTVLRDYGGDDVANLFDDSQTAVEGVAKDLIARRGSQLTRLKAAKDRVIDKFAGSVSTPNAIRAIDEQVARLKGINDDAYGPVIAKLEGFKQQLASGKTLRQIEGNRALLGDMFADQSLASVKGEGQKAINAIYAPLRSDMGAFITANGNKADFGRWKGANDQLAAMAGELKSGAFKSVLNNAETTPESASKLLFNTNPSEVRRLFANLSPVGQAKARSAVLQRAFDRAISADSGLSVERFINNLDSLGSSVGVVFKGIDKERIQGLVRILDVTRRAAEAKAMPATGVQNMPVVAGYALGNIFGNLAIPVAGMGGLVAKVYESAPVRNILIGLGKTKPGSPQEAALLNRATQAIAKVMASNAVRSSSTAMNENLPMAGRLVASPDERPDDPNQ